MLALFTLKDASQIKVPFVQPPLVQENGDHRDPNVGVYGKAATGRLAIFTEKAPISAENIQKFAAADSPCSVELGMSGIQALDDELCQVLMDQRWLVTLEVNSGYLWGVAWYQLAKLLFNAPNIQNLALRAVSIWFENQDARLSWFMFAKYLRETASLQSLHWSNCALPCDLMDVLAEALAVNTSITYLKFHDVFKEMGRNRMEPKDHLAYQYACHHILSVNKTLQHVDIEGFFSESASCAFFTGPLAHHPSIKSVRFAREGKTICGENLRVIFDGILASNLCVVQLPHIVVSEDLDAHVQAELARVNKERKIPLRLYYSREGDMSQ
jgi:hypothetical protein